MRVKVLTYAIILCVALYFMSCNNKEKKINYEEAMSLYEKSIVLYNSYIDSVSQATDSTEYFRLLNNFDEIFTKLNYEFTADTDLLLSEEENDSLISLSKRYSEIRYMKLKKLTNKNVERDSVHENEIEIRNTD